MRPPAPASNVQLAIQTGDPAGSDTAVGDGVNEGVVVPDGVPEGVGYDVTVGVTVGVGGSGGDIPLDGDAVAVVDNDGDGSLTP